MEYSYFIGFFVNLDLGLMQWVYVALTMLILLAGSSSALIYSKKSGLKGTINLLSYFFTWLIAGGIMGLVMSVLTHFITYAFISEFKKDYE